MTLRARLAELFVAPAASADAAALGRVGEHVRAPQARERPRVAAGASIVVLGGPEAVGAALAAGTALARAARAPYGLVCVCGDGGAGGRPALPRAAAAAARLRARGHAAQGRGRVVVVRLARAEEQQALAEAARAAAALGGDVPVVLAATGPLGETLDARLCDHDAVILTRRAGTDGLAAQVACARLGERHPGLQAVSVEVAAAVGPLRPGCRAVGRAVLGVLG